MEYGRLASPRATVCASKRAHLVGDKPNLLPTQKQKLQSVLSQAEMERKWKQNKIAVSDIPVFPSLTEGRMSEPRKLMEKLIFSSDLYVPLILACSEDPEKQKNALVFLCCCFRFLHLLSCNRRKYSS